MRSINNHCVQAGPSRKHADDVAEGSHEPAEKNTILVVNSAYQVHACDYTGIPLYTAVQLLL